MPICQSCSNTWSWEQTIKSIFRLRCPYCSKKQYESAASRNRGMLFMIIPLIALPVSIWFDFSVGTAIILSVILGFIIIGLYPFVLKLSNEEDPYF